MFQFHLAFPVDSEKPYAVAVNSSTKCEHHKVKGGSAEDHLRNDSGADRVIKLAPTNDRFFEFSPFFQDNFHKWLQKRKAEDIDPADLYSSGKSDGAACALAWLLADRQPDFNENDGLPVIFVSCAIKKDINTPHLIIERVANDESGTDQLKQKWKTVSETAKSHPVIFVLHTEDTELLLKQINPVPEIFIIKTMDKDTLPDFCKKSSGRMCIIKADSDDFDRLAFFLGADSRMFEKDYEMKKKFNKFVDIILQPNDTGSDSDDMKLKKQIQSAELTLKAVFESHDEAKKRRVFAALIRLADKNPSDKHLLEKACLEARESVNFFRKESGTNPDKYLRTFAGSLMILASCCRYEGNLEESLSHIIEATEIRRSLYRKSPEIFTPTLAGTLNSLSAAYCNAGKYEKALNATEEAVKLYRTLAESDPVKYRHILSGTLNCLVICYKYFNKTTEVEKTINEINSL